MTTEKNSYRTPPTVEQMDVEIRKNLILDSINSIIVAENRWRESQTDPTADADDRDAASYQMDCRLKEFSGQWKNVKYVLESLTPA